VVASALGESARLGAARRVDLWEFTGGPFPLWLLETDRLTESEETALALFSRTFLRDPRPIIEHWRDTPHAAVLAFVIQQIEQFKRLGDAFAMQHTDTSTMSPTLQEAVESALKSMTREELKQLFSKANLLEGIPPEELVKIIPPEELVKIIPPEELVKIIPPEKLVHAVTPEEIVRSLDPKELEQLRRLLDERIASENPNNGEDAPA
jgi:hypothetical protein